MLARLVFGVLLFSGLYSLFALLSGDSVREEAATGAVFGLVSGAMWHYQHLRATKYRAEHELPGPSLTRESLRPPQSAEPVTRRYRMHPAPLTVMAVAFAMFAAVATAASLSSDAPPGVAVFLWVLTAASGVAVWAFLSVYTDIKPAGIGLHKPFTSSLVPWVELAGIGWHRDSFGDVPVLSTADGRQIKAAGILIADSGEGRGRTLRMLEDLEHNWALSTP